MCTFFVPYTHSAQHGHRGMVSVVRVSMTGVCGLMLSCSSSPYFTLNRHITTSYFVVIHSILTFRHAIFVFFAAVIRPTLCCLSNAQSVLRHRYTSRMVLQTGIHSNIGRYRLVNLWDCTDQRRSTSNPPLRRSSVGFKYQLGARFRCPTHS